MLPLAMLWVSKLILDGVVAWIKRGNGDPAALWKLVALELGLAVLSDLLARANSLADSLLGDRFTNRISVRLIEHATRLDLASFEDPVFYDKLGARPPPDHRPHRPSRGRVERRPGCAQPAFALRRPDRLLPLADGPAGGCGDPRFPG